LAIGAAALLLLSAGCSGINASKSVSPMDILPALLQADPPPAQPDRVPSAGEAVQQIAKN